MPLYEYRCLNCGEHFDVRQKFADATLTVHEQCGGKVERVLSAPALQFKGSGFYITDYAKGSNSPANGEKKKGDGSSANSDAGSKSDSPSKTETTAKSDSPAKSEPSKTKSESKPSASSDTK